MKLGLKIIVGALADGPLPVADIVGIVVSIGAVAVLAANWSQIEKKWPAIEKAFEKCFNSIASDISKSFSKIKIKVEDVYYSGNFKDFESHYKKHAKEFVNLPGGNGKKPNRKKIL